MGGEAFFPSGSSITYNAVLTYLREDLGGPEFTPVGRLVGGRFYLHCIVQYKDVRGFDCETSLYKVIQGNSVSDVGNTEVEDAHNYRT